MQTADVIYSCMPNGVVIDATCNFVGAHLRVRPTTGDRQKEKRMKKTPGAQPTTQNTSRQGQGAAPIPRPAPSFSPAGCRINLYPAPIIIKI